MFDPQFMQRAIDLAASGRGCVEPNPLVGAVVVRDNAMVGEGFHAAYGDDHAEVVALRNAGSAAADADLYVTLEPCCHHGKTPPCTEGIIAAGIRRVFVAMSDPFPQVGGQGIARLIDAGIEVEVVDTFTAASEQLNAPYLKLIQQAKPWVIAKWAMTLDGKIATHTGDSQWISSDASRQVVHTLRGKMDAIMAGSVTCLTDDPLLTARPPGPRTAARVVIDSAATIPVDSQLVQTATDIPTLIAVHAKASQKKQDELIAAGCELLVSDDDSHLGRLNALLAELGRRRWTNVLVEGGGTTLGALMEIGQIDEVYAFISPRLVGGKTATTPIAGDGVAQIADALKLDSLSVGTIGDDICVHGRVQRAATR